MSVRDEIHLSDPTRGPSYCGAPVTLIEAAGDTRPICQACHRGSMKTMRKGWCPCAMGRPQDCRPEDWPRSARHGLSDSYRKRSAAVSAVLGLHRRAPVYDTHVDACSEHDIDAYGVEASDGELYCSKCVSEYTCMECAELNRDNADGEIPEWPCPTVKAIQSALEAKP